MLVVSWFHCPLHASSFIAWRVNQLRCTLFVYQRQRYRASLGGVIDFKDVLFQREMSVCFLKIIANNCMYDGGTLFTVSSWVMRSILRLTFLRANSSTFLNIMFLITTSKANIWKPLKCSNCVSILYLSNSKAIFDCTDNWYKSDWEKTQTLAVVTYLFVWVLLQLDVWSILWTRKTSPSHLFVKRGWLTVSVNNFCVLLHFLDHLRKPLVGPL